MKLKEEVLRPPSDTDNFTVLEGFDEPFQITLYDRIAAKDFQGFDDLSPD